MTAHQNLPLVIDTAVLPPRIAKMIEMLYRHRAVICAYQTGQLVLHFHGAEVKPQLHALGLNSLQASTD